MCRVVRVFRMLWKRFVLLEISMDYELYKKLEALRDSEGVKIDHVIEDAMTQYLAENHPELLQPQTN